VKIDGVTVFDRKKEDGRYPSVTDVRAWKKPLRARLEAEAKVPVPA